MLHSIRKASSEEGIYESRTSIVLVGYRVSRRFPLTTYNTITAWDFSYGFRLPVPADASNVQVTFPSIDIHRITDYQTRLSVANIQSFYRAVFAGRGWTCEPLLCEWEPSSATEPAVEGGIGFQRTPFGVSPFYQIRSVGITVSIPDSAGWRTVRVFETLR